MIFPSPSLVKLSPSPDFWAEPRPQHHYTAWMVTKYFEDRAFVAKASSIVSIAGITVAMFVAGCSAESSQEKKSIASLKIYSKW
jgi:hypothetical protein